MDRNLRAMNRSRRVWLLWAGSALAVAAARPFAVRAAQTAVETRSVSGFDEVIFAAAGELEIVQAPRERLTIEAEPQVLRKITSEVHGRQLMLGFTSGNVISRAPIRFRLEMPNLRMLDLQSAGTVQIGPLDVERLSLRLSGSGDIRLDLLNAQDFVLRLPGSGSVSVADGRVGSQRIELGGSGTVDTAGLASQTAEASISGSGDVRLAASKHLKASISGSGSVRYAGHPELVASITGAGTIDRELSAGHFHSAAKTV